MTEVAIDYRGYVSPRGDVMLDVYFNGEHAYLLGPFENKEQRRVFIAFMKDGWEDRNRQQKFKLTG